MAEFTGDNPPSFTHLQGNIHVNADDITEVAGGGGLTLIYRMRGFDQHISVNSIVYWSATEADSDASEYEGSAGPVVDIVVVGVKGV